MGLNLPIEFNGYEGLVPTVIPYTNNNPVAFYKWWRKAENSDKVILSKYETIKLLINVYQMEPNALLVKHKEMIKK